MDKAKPGIIVLSDKLDWRFSILIKAMIIFNAIPVLLLSLYFVISTIAIYSTALFIQFSTFLFGLAIFAPIILFSSFGAVIVTFVIIISQQGLVKENLRQFPCSANYERLKAD